jgi:4-amino-4-deoxy-L-arabinose transferase-like glycosyltransferase
MIRVVIGMLIGALILQAVGSMWNDAPTFDEIVSPAAGYAELVTGDLGLIDDHPPLARILMALPLLAFQPVVPLDHYSWRDKERERRYRYEFAQQFFYGANREADRMIYWSRLPIVFLSTLLGLLLFQWATVLYGSCAGLLTLFLYVFEPNLMAHSRLATNDLPITLWIVCVVVQFWRYRQKPSVRNLALTGVLCGFALLVKFSALILFPILFLLAFFVPFPFRLKRDPSSRLEPFRACTTLKAVFQAVVTSGFVLTIALAVTLAFYGTSWRLFWQGINNAVIHYGASHLAARGHPAFLMGEISLVGWWYYFPIAFAVKTPIPLLLYILAAVLLFSFKKNKAEYFLLIPIGILLLAGLTSDLNIGLRHMLPAYPFLLVLAGSIVTAPFSRPRFFCVSFGALGGWYLASTLAIFPSYLAYFNEFIGSENGHRVLVDSNLDWGQDLKRLKQFMSQKKIQQVYLSYFGTADPCYYGIRFLSLPGTSSHCGDPPEPAAIRYLAISATNLQSVYLPFKSYEWLKKLKPAWRIGYSIYLYDIENSAATHNDLGILFLQYHMFQEAIAEFKLVAELQPQESTAHANLGVAYSFLPDLVEAEKAFRKALELDPENAMAKRGLALVKTGV